MKTSQTDHTKGWTADDFLLLEETNNPCELINGEIIMSPSPTTNHQDVVSNLHDFLKAEARRTGGKVYLAPTDFHINQLNVFQPDLIFIRKENRQIITRQGIKGIPNIVVEVLSPSNANTDRNLKKKVYLEMGVEEYWIIDPEKRILEIYSLQEGVYHIDLHLIETGLVTTSVIPALKFHFEDLFFDLGTS